PCLLTAPSIRATPALSLHDALPIWPGRAERDLHRERDAARAAAAYRGTAARRARARAPAASQLERGSGTVPCGPAARLRRLPEADRKSTRLNSSHVKISYAVFCLKK